MQVILLERIGKLGDLGQQVHVKPGYGRNFLIPSGKAVPATPGNIEKFEAQRADLEKAQEEVLTTAQARAEKLNELEVTIQRKLKRVRRLPGMRSGCRTDPSGLWGNTRWNCICTRT